MGAVYGIIYTSSTSYDIGGRRLLLYQVYIPWFNTTNGNDDDNYTRYEQLFEVSTFSLEERPPVALQQPQEEQKTARAVNNIPGCWYAIS